jgi:hypothetical protein
MKDQPRLLDLVVGCSLLVVIVARRLLFCGGWLMKATLMLPTIAEGNDCRRDV